VYLDLFEFFNARQLANVTEDCQQSRDENSVLKGQIEQLHKTIEHLRSGQVERHSRIEQFETAKVSLLRNIWRIFWNVN